MRVLGGFLSTAMVSLAVAACAPHTTEKNAIHKKVALGSPTDPCPSGLTHPANEDYAVDLGPGFKVSKTGLTVKPKHAPAHETQMDVFTNLQDGQYAKVTINLRGDLALQPGSAFKVKDPSSALIFCALSVASDNGSLTFNTFRQAGSPTYAAYTLGVTAKDASNKDDALTVSIDPGVDNDGIISIKSRNTNND